MAPPAWQAMLDPDCMTHCLGVKGAKSMAPRSHTAVGSAICLTVMQVGIDLSEPP